MARRRGTKWQADVREGPSRRHRPTFDTQHEAEAWETAARKAIRAGLPIPLTSAAVPLLGQYADRCLDQIWGDVKMSLCRDSEDIPEEIRIVATDGICADHVINRMCDAKPGSLAILDYMQLLDQDRRKPEIAVQIEAPRSFAAESGLVFVLLSQIDRSWDAARKPLSDMADIRLPNPVPLSAYARACILHEGEIRLDVGSA